MAATQTEINEYIFAIRSKLSEYGHKLSKYQRLGKQDLECRKLKFRLLNHYIRIIIEYLSLGVNYSSNNFFTISEATDVIQHINNILDENYTLNL